MDYGRSSMHQEIEEYLAYLELERGLSSTTRASYRLDLARFEAFLSVRHVRSVADVQSIHVREFLQGLRAEHQPATVAGWCWARKPWRNSRT